MTTENNTYGLSPITCKVLGAICDLWWRFEDRGERKIVKEAAQRTKYRLFEDVVVNKIEENNE
ncbi:hypothetical protein LCGC14_2011500 [marine sediment metagenome]|uniref:Uncharacterized protein n=1 Tax=marine sediment metagenome TaxID=412755 RepID=A0A0F9HDM9_9ZZZZ